MALAVARGVLAVTSAGSPDGIAQLQALANRPDGLSRVLLVRRDGEWHPYG